LARPEAEAGADFLEVNIGPARRDGAELMPWLVETIHAVIDLPLSLDTTNLEAMEAGLQAHKKGGRPLVNSVSCQADRMDTGIALVKKYNALMVGLLWGSDGMPRDVNERAAHVVDLVYRANEAGIPSEDIFIDPIATPLMGEINQVKACADLLLMLPEIAPGCKSIVGLSNVSNGAPAELRPYLNRAYLLMLQKNGLYSAILDAYDNEIMDLSRGTRPELSELVGRIMDGAAVDEQALTPEQLNYARSVKVLNGEVLYSNSWLEG